MWVRMGEVEIIWYKSIFDTSQSLSPNVEKIRYNRKWRNLLRDSVSIQLQFQLFPHKDTTFLFQSERRLKKMTSLFWVKWEVWGYPVMPVSTVANMKWRKCYSHQFLLLSICFITCYGRCYFLSTLSLSHISLSLLPVWNIHEKNRVSCYRCCPYFYVVSIFLWGCREQ